LLRATGGDARPGCFRRIIVDGGSWFNGPLGDAGARSSPRSRTHLEPELHASYHLGTRDPEPDRPVARVATMPRSISKGLTAERVRAAHDDLDARVAYAFGEPTACVLVHGEKRYPPKAIIGLAL
jgi:hypothetical protein